MKLDAIVTVARYDAGLERVFLDLLFPAALRLNQLYAEDVLDLAATVVASCTLLGLVRQYAPAFRYEGVSRKASSRTLLVSSDRAVDAVGLLGLCLVSEFLRRDGWNVRIEQDMTSQAFRTSIATEWYDCIEIFASRNGDENGLTRAVDVLRRRALNPSTRIGVSHSAFEGTLGSGPSIRY